jgi:hypothetical protein
VCFGIIFLALATLWALVADPPKPNLVAQREIPAPNEAAHPAPPTSVAISELPFPGELHEPQSSLNLTGVPEILDTSTLLLNGKLVRLFGVHSGGSAENLERYLAGRPVACTPSGKAHTFHCQVDGRDVSELVLFNGAGRTNEDATPQLRAAENGARAQRIGVWTEPQDSGALVLE